VITAQIFGVERLLVRFHAMHPRIHRELSRTVQRLAIKLTAHVKQNKLTGQVLKVRTGTLRRSINHQVTETPTSTLASVGTNLSYAAIHEYGFEGVVNVRAHLRLAKVVFGRALATPVVQHVGAHARHVNMPRRSFLRSALKDLKPEIMAQLEAAARQTAKEVMK
jgi:phage gpG-like protein